MCALWGRTRRGPHGIRYSTGRRLPRFAVEFLAQDLRFRRLQEKRFLHKILKWPEFVSNSRSRGVRLVRSTPLKTKTGREKHSYGRVCNSDAYARGFRRGIERIRAGLVKVAHATCSKRDLKNAENFKALADMKRNRQVWQVNPGDVIGPDFQDKHFQVKGKRKYEAIEDSEFIGWCYSERWGEYFDKSKVQLHIGKAVRGRWFEVTQSGKTELWRDRAHPSMPAVPDRVVGQHNGSHPPRKYAFIPSRGHKAQDRKDLAAIKAFEKRNSLFEKSLADLTYCGGAHAIKRYCRDYDSEAVRAETARKYPEIICKFEMAFTKSYSAATEIFGEINASLFCDRAFSCYLADHGSSRGWVCRGHTTRKASLQCKACNAVLITRPLEMQIAEAELEHTDLSV